MNKVKSMAKSAALVLLAVLAVYGAFQLTDFLADRRLGDWFARKFLFETYWGNNGGAPFKTVLFMWDTFKGFTLKLLMAGAAFWVSTVLVTAAVCKRRAGRAMEARNRDFQAQMYSKEQEVQQETDRKNELIAYLAHDLKTPMTSIIGYLSLLEEAPEMPAEQRANCVHIALDKAFRLEALINEFFEITRYNLHEVVLDKRAIDLGYMLSQMADEFYPVLKEHGNEVQLDVAEDLTVAVDAAKLARVFNNILKNAIAYSHENTPIEITAHTAEDWVRITVTNQGQPIPAQKLASIFDKFYRLDEARSTNTGGAGLGLAIAKEIVTAHGGRISAESREGRTTFTVELPCR